MGKANVDRILEILRQKKSLNIKDLASQLGIKKEDAEKSAEYLEQDGVVRIEHRFPNTIVALVGDASSFGNTDSSMMPPLDLQKQQETKEQPAGKKPMLPKLSIPKLKQAKPEAKQPKPEPVNQFPQPSWPGQKGQKKVEWPGLENQKKAEWPEDIKKTVKTEEKKQDVPKTPKKEEPVILKDENPLEPETPGFYMAPPDPDGEHVYHFEAYYDFPEDIKTDSDKISFLLTEINKKIASRNYDGLNKMYRVLYDIYNNTVSMSPNELYRTAGIIQAVFDKIKNLYMKQQAV